MHDVNCRSIAIADIVSQIRYYSVDLSDVLRIRVVFSAVMFCMEFNMEMYCIVLYCVLYLIWKNRVSIICFQSQYVAKKFC